MYGVTGEYGMVGDGLYGLELPVCGVGNWPRFGEGRNGVAGVLMPGD